MSRSDVVLRIAGASKRALSLLVRGFGYDAERTASWAKSLEEINPSRAAELYRQALRQPPRVAWIRIKYADFLIKQGHDDELIEVVLREAAEIEPTDAYTLSAYVAFARKRKNGLADAIDRLERALIAQPDDIWLTLQFAVLIAEQDGSLDRAEPFLQELARTHPEHGGVQYIYGFLLATFSDRRDEAAQYIKAAMSLSPRDLGIARFAGGFFLHTFPEPQAAESCLRIATEINAADDKSLFLLAELQRVFRRDMDAAETLYQRAINVSSEPRYVEALASFLCVIRNQPGEAERTYGLAVELAIQPQWIRPSLAYFLHRVRGDSGSARAQLELAVEESSRHPSFVFALASFLGFELSEHATAAELFREVAGGNDLSAVQLSVYAAFVAGCLKDVPKAEPLFRRAFEMKRDDPYVLLNLGTFLAEHGRADEGLAHLDSVLDRLVGPMYEDWGLVALLLCLIYGPVSRHPALVKRLKAALAVGERSPMSHLMHSVKHIESGHGALAIWLGPLVDVVTMRSPVSALGDWPDWRDA
ncbi:MAG: Tetratricopeptide repeat [Thermomicrobiales bacterium]|nr:Tetratricopeptide repeat [Thermomicrobiales bacterium]